jgi:hypothetical protein
MPPATALAPKHLTDVANARRVSAREYSRKAFDAAADIGKLPPCADPGRRHASGQSLLEFLTVYFPYSTGLSPLGSDQIAAIERVEVALLEGGWTANIMPRGFIKSTLSENSLLWAMLYGYHKYGLFFAGTAALATSGILSIKRELVTNELLLEDFPEACIPFIKLEGKAQRTQSQTYQGKLTNLIAKGDTIRLAMIPGYPCAGAIIEAYGLLAPPRGARYKNEKGENVRPGIAICDDPQTDDSAKSVTQTDSRMRYIRNSISMMGAHGKELSIIVNATIIQDGDLADQISDPTASDGWQSVRSQMVKKMPAALDTHWLMKYADIRRQYDRDDPRGRIKAKEASTEYLRQNYDVMHAGAEVSWENIGLERTEISALQHAMNILIDKGPDTFYAECQNKPVRATSVSSLELTVENLKDRFSGYEHRVVPIDTSFLVFGCDVHDNLIYYTVAAVQNDFTGRVIDYGVWPEQPTAYISLRSAKNPLSKHYSESSIERAIELGVEDLVHRLLTSDWQTPNGDIVGISCGLVDSGYKPVEVRNAIRRLLPASRVVLSSRGVGIGPTKTPMEEYDTSPKKVIKAGPDPHRPNWVLPTSERDGELFHVLFDANFWKTTLAARLSQAPRVAKWELFGNRFTNHEQYLKHLTSEYPNQVTANGRTVNVWETFPNQPNHWWDTTVLCAVAASMCGAELPSTRDVPPPEPPPKPEPTPDAKFEGEDGRGFFITTRD